MSILKEIEELQSERDLIDNKIESLRSKCCHDWVLVDSRIVPDYGTEYSYSVVKQYQCVGCLLEKTEYER